VPKTAAIPKFRQSTVPTPRPPQSAIKRAAAPTQTWSPLTQRFTPAPQAPKSDAIVEANRLQAERRAHNKQFGNQ
ncbi:MAG: hypothetical protein CMB79_10915, partial [Filomicrobium sp.]|nr:hypothetical protein [Filomicrobium sp.]